MNNMKISYILKRTKRAVVMLVIAVACTMTAWADLPEDSIVMSGIVYKTNFCHATLKYCYDDITKEEWFTLKANWRNNLRTMASWLQAKGDEDQFEFYDGSSLPVFEYGAKVHVPYVGYYSGEVWLQDSVKMKALPYPRNTKYHIVCDISQIDPSRDCPRFDEKLTFIRTPRYTTLNSQWFKDCVGLSTVRIGAASRVCTGSFENCPRLETVYFESSPYVDENAFKNCPNIRRVVLASKLPLPLSLQGEFIWRFGGNETPSPFDQEVYEKATLYISADQIEAAKQHPTWGRFLNIRDIQEYISGVETVEADAEVEYEVYNMSGVQVRTACSGREWREGLPPGVYIVRSSRGDVRKEQVR